MKIAGEFFGDLFFLKCIDVIEVERAKKLLVDEDACLISWRWHESIGGLVCGVGKGFDGDNQCVYPLDSCAIGLD